MAFVPHFMTHNEWNLQRQVRTCTHSLLKTNPCNQISPFLNSNSQIFRKSKQQIQIQIQIYLLPFLQCYYIQGARHLGTSKSLQQF